MADVTADRSAEPTDLPEVRDYLARLEVEGRGLPPDRLADVLDDVRSHVRDALSAEGAAGTEPAVVARNVLERLGTPAEIVRAEAEQSGVVAPALAPAGPGLMQRVGEPVAIVLLMFGGFLVGIGWFVGVALLWGSPSWRLREKLLGTFVWPFGYLGVLLVGGLVTSVESCVSSGTSVGGTDTMSCTGGPPYPDWVGGLIFAVVVAAPIVVAVLLWRRRQAVLRGAAS